ncbi:MAG: glycosyltransferase family 2 protein [Acidobacteria bacterium]|nr:glycosyltransferase family 2 protein [Acidobacteriota bacterium]
MPMQQVNNAIQGNTRLSVVVRFHKEERLPFLEEAVFSLAIQDWDDLEVIVVLQNGTDELQRAVESLIHQQPWPDSPQYKIVTVPITEGVDGRSTLLNHGIKHATGRFLAFLDDDDYVYHHGYVTLIRQLLNGESVIALGGCRRALMQPNDDHWFIQTKDQFFAWGRTRLDLFRENFIPIHSYVIDRSRLGDFKLYFDDDLPPLEDYDFLLRLCSKFEPDFAQFETPVCEYRIRLDGSNSLAYVPDAPSHVVAAQKRAQRLIRERKESLISNMPAADLVKLKEGLLESIGERRADDGNQTRDVQEINDGTTAYQPEPDNRVLLKITQDIYLFFSRHPDWERRLSNTLHTSWKAYKRLRR